MAIKSSTYGDLTLSGDEAKQFRNQMKSKKVNELGNQALRNGLKNLKEMSLLENYQEQHHYQNKSDVIKEALHLLELENLKKSYMAANSELDDEFESTTADGIEQDEERY